MGGEAIGMMTGQIPDPVSAERQPSQVDALRIGVEGAFLVVERRKRNVGRSTLPVRIGAYLRHDDDRGPPARHAPYRLTHPDLGF